MTPETIRRHFRTALRFASQAAGLIEPHFDAEPSRSILHQSAASLALQCDELREAERLIASALRGTPPDDLAEELRDGALPGFITLKARSPTTEAVKGGRPMVQTKGATSPT
jgi:hypothetical protein